MQWDATANGGFTTGKPWLPVAEDLRRFNVAIQSNEADSFLTLYRRLITLRAETAALHSGAYGELVGNDHVLGYSREAGRSGFWIMLNFSGESKTFEHRNLRGRINFNNRFGSRKESVWPASLCCVLMRVSLSNIERSKIRAKRRTQGFTPDLKTGTGWLIVCSHKTPI